MNAPELIVNRGKRTLCWIGYLLVAAVALVPLLPVIALMYVAKWVHVNDTGDDFDTAQGHSRPVRSPRVHQVLRPCSHDPDVTTITSLV